MNLKKIKKKLFYIFHTVIITIIFLTLFTFIAFAETTNNTYATEKNFDMTPFFWVVGIVGGCIALTLSYVSWRKYQAVEKKQSKHDVRVD